MSDPEANLRATRRSAQTERSDIDRLDASFSWAMPATGFAFLLLSLNFTLELLESAVFSLVLVVVSLTYSISLHIRRLRAHKRLAELELRLVDLERDDELSTRAAIIPALETPALPVASTPTGLSGVESVVSGQKSHDHTE